MHMNFRNVILTGERERGGGGMFERKREKEKGIDFIYVCTWPSSLKLKT